ncbi:hypothetical protein [Nonomuraea lactucae]|uniref:hypothetical protein n=1 Tax=Nonomuraea lactucae TaxID=2249762 RepID=UPI0013B3C717|nr:hypothetical protein [Nonomuraea lactucae]
MAAALAAATGIAIAPSFYLVAVTLIASAVLLRWLPETLGTDLAEAGQPKKSVV